MNGRVTSSAPTGALPQIRRVIRMADVNLLTSHAGPLHLGVALQAKVWITLDQQLPVDRAVRVVADSASLAQSFVFEDKRPALLAVAG